MDKRKILLKIKEKFGFKSDADFARYIGISPQNLSNWYARQSFDENLLLVKFTNINKQWLLTGEGNILNDEINAVNYGSEILKGKELPYVINTEMIPDAAAGYQYEVDMSPRKIEIGWMLRDSEFAINVYGNSMVPNYPAGSIIGIKVHNDNFIVPGSVYVVETESNRYIKRLYYNKDKSAFKCISDNTMLHDCGPMKGELFYPEFEIPLTSVKRMFAVVGIIKRNLL